ncbi:hypothetical protein F8388_005957 [Cannabis sativa]|uniref:DUF4283 domain-containing protein n=1 Tax=Cannabis sativa TaxID=3483 RepID=A0A7J6IA50_CANSA|nr:hypothetical protein F8388_005957 [Cannabis sativa]KAF4404472.1 hypothetical protein G4B88_005858 [Cannabis sativa]
MASMGVKDIQVESVDEEMNTTLVRDGAIEMELLELFEDITLEEVVVNKACVGKIVGCKDMPTSVVKKILTGVWRRLGPWKMKKCEEGVLGFFFHNEEDCAFVLQKRPWLVNGVLLNIKPWPVEGEVRTGEFAVARFWVQIHGLPTRCLTNDNAEIVAKKIGELADTDGSSKAEVVRRGYLRIDTGNSNCFNSKGKGVLKWELEEIPEWELQGRRRRGVWNRKVATSLPGGAVPSEKGKQQGGDTAEPLRQSKTLEEKGQSYIAGTSSGSVAPASSTMIGTGNLHVALEGDHEVINVPGNILNLPNPDFANYHHRDDLIPDLGPTLAQCIDVPHEWVCLSQNPHSFPEACPISWPNHDTKAQKLFMQLYKPDFLNLYKAQQSLLSIPPNLSEMINHLLGNNKKRKAHTLLQPIPSISTFSSPENQSQQKLTEKTEVIPQEAFCIGVGDEASCSRSNGRGRKPKGRTAYSTRRSSGYWDWLTTTVKGCNANWAVIGDLNVIMNVEEKEGGKRFHDKEGELLRDFLFDTGGIDLGCEGGCTTWQNSRNARGRIRKRLDRVVAKAEWCIDFQKAKVVKFPILGSDHAPICLQTSGDNLKLRYPFRFLEVWTSHPDCERVVKGAWNQSESLLVRKLANTKWELKKWNQEVFGFCDRKLYHRWGV